jgi:signal transduction histidine kinase/CheY-like chemotaxis protein
LLFRKYKHTDVVRFHKRNAIYMTMVFIFLLTAFFLLLANQYSLNAENENKLLLGNFQEHISELDNLLARITTQVENMRIQAESDMMEMRLSNRTIPPLSYSFLKEADGGGSFHLDNYKAPVKREQIGNLTGLGSLTNRDTRFYSEIYMALKLNPQFRAISSAIKDAAWIYYTSSRGFINIYPWVPSREFRFSSELYTHEFYTLGTPKMNRDRKFFWTEVYVDEYGKGLMTTCAAPVYDRDDFLGTVAIDLTVDFLNTKVKKFRAEKGVMFLLNDRKQLLAHPSLITSLDKRTKTMIEALPENLRPAYESIIKSPNDGSLTLNGYTLLHSKLKYAPWHAYYIESKPSMWKSFLNRIGLGALILLFTLLIMMIVILIVTHLKFVVPSGKLVNFIIKRNKRDFTGDYGSVPKIWNPWFSAIDNAFRENDELTYKIRKQNEELEERVAARTAELVDSNQKMLIEIAERKQAEEALKDSERRLHDIIQGSPIPAFVIGKDHRIIYWNKALEELSDIKAEKVIGTSEQWRAFYSKERPCMADLLVDQALEVIPQLYFKKYIKSRLQEEAYEATDFFTVMRDTGKWLRFTAAVIRDSQGDIVGAMETLEDITERKQTEEENLRLAELLQRAEKMEALGTLAGGVAHDLNNVLGIVVGYAELLLNEVDKANSIRPRLVKIMEGGQRAAAIVQDMLTLARRGVSGKQVLNLNKIITDYQQSPEFENLSSQHPSVRIMSDLDPDLLNIAGSSVHLGKTLLNLVLNATEAMTKGGNLTIKTGNQYLDKPIQGYDEIMEGDYVVLSVSDTGEGISVADLKHIFEPFYTKKIMGRSGTGLGLSVVWGTVKDHHGYINVQSEEGKGSTFTLYFPVTREEITPQSAVANISEYMGRGEAILVVDDVEGQRDLAAEMLRNLNYNVTSVSSGEKAIAYIKEHNIDLMVLDMIMDPGMDGLDTYRSVLEIRPKQKAIIVSGFSETDRVSMAQALGAGAYVRKPYILERLGLAVRKELDISQ